MLVIVQAQHDAVAADTFCIGVHDVVLSGWVWMRVRACSRRGRAGSGSGGTMHGSVPVSLRSLRLHLPRLMSDGRQGAW